MNKFNYIDLFAGCGGLSLGLHNAGWKGLFAIEKSDMAFETLKFNLIDKKKHFSWFDWLPKKSYDINYFIKKFNMNLKDLSGKVDLVVGGPPCQGFSMAGRRTEGDQRNSLIKSYIKFIKLIQPKMLLFENVKGFTIGFKKGDSRGKPYSDYVISKLKELGYDVDGQLIDFSEFGVPQKRQRFIIVGIKNGLASDFFNNLHKSAKLFRKNKGLSTTKSITVKDAISDLLKSNKLIQSPDGNSFEAGTYSQSKSTYQNLMRCNNKLKFPDSHRFPNHNTLTIEKFQTILNESEKNKNINNVIRKRFDLKKHCIIPLDGNKCAPTLTTLPDDYIHYKEPRILTVREYARIQSFPDWFEFKNKYTSGGKLRKVQVPRYTQIGNAVPPLFGEIAGIILKKLINKQKLTLQKEVSV